MSHASIILSSLMMMAMLIAIAPNILALNHGRILRNTALWLALFLGLALFYKNFGPDSPHPLFALPESMQGMNRKEGIHMPPAKSPDKEWNQDEKPNPAASQP